MSTPYSDIFTKANVLFEDAPLLASLTDDEYSELLEIFLSKAKSIYFKSCKKNLADVNNTLKQFNQDLNLEEQWILAEGCKLVWLEKQLYKEEKLRDKLSTRDYDSKSPGNLLDKLNVLRNETKKTLFAMINSYSFNLFSGFN